MNAPTNSQAAQFCVNKIESLGTQKNDLVKRLAVAKETDTNVISMAQAKKKLLNAKSQDSLRSNWGKLFHFLKLNLTWMTLKNTGLQKVLYLIQTF